MEQRYQTSELGEGNCGGPWLVEVDDEAGPQTLPLEVGQCIVIGTSPVATLRLSDPHVSRVHAELLGMEVGVCVTDKDSRNGTRIGAAKVRRAVLEGAGGTVVVGRTTINISRRVEGRANVASGAPIAGLIGASEAMRRVRVAIRRYAKISASVLITGESGAGKDVVAHALHQLSGRKGAYVPLNIGGLSAQLADAELFGHTRGAFTGAVVSRKGAFETAHGGTLFLDEIGDLSPEVQVKLLRVLEDGWVRPLGSEKAIKVDVRVVAATWAPLDERVLEGAFREDLYHRIATVTLALPPLRKRKSDIPELVNHLLKQIEPEVGPLHMTSSALARLVAHEWPGNVRELRSVLYRAALAADHGRIDEDSVFEALPPKVNSKISREDVQGLLQHYGGNITAAARAARLPRSTFRDWIRRYQVDSEPSGTLEQV